MKRKVSSRLVVCLAAVLAAVAVSSGSAGGGEASRDTGTLTFQATLGRQSRPASCAAGSPASLDCFAREGIPGAVRGVGAVAVSYLYVVDTAPPECPSGSFKLRSFTARAVVASKGEFQLAVTEQAGCYVPGATSRVTQAFTITGGSGTYAGASGSGTVVHDISRGPVDPSSSDTWTGTLNVPGVEFDLTAPVLTGAVKRTVRAPKRANRVRVRYSVRARDDADGLLPVSCKPPTGSLFKRGRTVVRCSATDTSANTATATFTVNLKASR